MLRNLLCVALGGAIGSTARYLLSRLINEHSTGAPFPWGTLTVNVLGCLLIGLLCGLTARTSALSPRWQLLLITGLCGGFTTFSTFAYESYLLADTRRILAAAAYAALSLTLGLAAVWLGYRLTR